MRSIKAFPITLLAGAFLSSAALLCGSGLIAQAVAPSIRIVNRIDENQLVTLKGNTHPFAKAKNDRGRVSPDRPMTDLILVLNRSPEQQAAFEKFVSSQYDSSSPNFHQWLTPKQIGEDFGPAETDIAIISNWLTGHGFSVDEVARDRMSIRFSGTAAMIESTFHTEIHNLEVKGAQHIGNMSDPQIPAALSPVVVGVKALHNFFPRPLHRLGSMVSKDSATGKWKRIASASGAQPLFGINVPGSPPGCTEDTCTTFPYLVEDVAPYDFATIYNILPLWNAGTPIDGTGQVIAIAGTSDIDVGQTGETGANGNNDVLAFRNTFGLPAVGGTIPGIPANTPIRVSGNSQSLQVCTSTAQNALCGIGDLVENSLDVEWSGAIAKNAQIVLVASFPASATDDNLYDSESYIINHVDDSTSPVYQAHIMNVSYGECELGLGTAGNVEYYNLWNTAYAEGLAVFVAAGDSGSASCDDGDYVAEYGLTVSGLASTPWNTAVGGTDFNWCLPDTSSGSAFTECSASPYWNSSNTASGASVNASGPQSGYVPETPWNESCANPLTLPWVQDLANYLYGYPSSQIANVEQACNFVYQFSYGNEYNPGGSPPGLGYEDPFLEYLVETVGGSGGASGCVVNSTNPTGTTTGACTAGSTSTGATTNPDTNSPQGSIPLYNNGWIKPKWQQPSINNIPGLPNDGVRDLPDVSFFASDGYVSSSAYLMCASATNTNNAPCSYSTYTEPFYQEVGGTSVATPAMAGVMALINQKTGAFQGNPNSELYALAATQTYSSCSAETVTTSSKCYFNDIDTGTNAMPCDASDSSPNCTTTLSTLGIPDQIAILPGYSGVQGYDQATGLGSLNVANVVNSFIGIGNHPATLTVTPASNSITANEPLNVTVTVASASVSEQQTPTGTIILAASGVTGTWSATIGQGSCTAANCVITIPGDSLSAGNNIVLTANYSGDAIYTQESNTASISVTQLIPNIQVSAAPTLNSNYPLQVTVTVSATGTGGTPTGTVTLSAPRYTSTAVTLNSNGVASFTIPANTFTATTSGTVMLSASYSGDPTYTTNIGTTTVTVTYVAVLMPTVSVKPASDTVDSNAPLNVTATVSGASALEASPTGTVTLSGGGLTPTLTGTLLGGSYTFTVPAGSLNAGADTLTVTYNGDPFYSQNTGTASVTVTESTFQLSATAAAAISSPGGNSTTTITATAVAGYVGTATLTSCTLSGYSFGDAYLPTCSGPVPSTPLTMGGAGAVFTVNTTAESSELTYPKLPGKGRGAFGAGGGMVLAFLIFLGIPARRRSWRSMLGLILLMAALGSLSACGGSGGSGGGGGITGTTPDTYTFTVSATGNPSVTPAVTTTFTVVVN
jgi:hypothetical protein